LAARTPCHLIKRVGRVALLYRPLADKADKPVSGQQKGSAR
jgi:hypothetical protein